MKAKGRSSIRRWSRALKSGSDQPPKTQTRYPPSASADASFTARGLWQRLLPVKSAIVGFLPHLITGHSVFGGPIGSTAARGGDTAISSLRVIAAAVLSLRHANWHRLPSFQPNHLERNLNSRPPPMQRSLPPNCAM